MLRNFFDISNLSDTQLVNIILNHLSDTNLKNKNIGCLYEKPSTRTRLSFAVGVNQLQGKTIDIRLDELNFSREESLVDTFKAMGCYLDGLIYRTISHKRLSLASEYMNKPIINALSEKSHPCQILADLITLFERFKSLELEISWFGDINNVLFSLIEATNLLGSIKLNIFSHTSLIENMNWEMNKNIFLYDQIKNEVISKSNCIMTDVFVSMNDDDEKKIDLLKDFQVNDKIMQNTSNDCVFMHCLPAKIGMEVSEDVIKSNKSIVWHQAYNRLIAQKRLMKCINW